VDVQSHNTVAVSEPLNTVVVVNFFWGGITSSDVQKKEKLFTSPQNNVNSVNHAYFISEQHFISGAVNFCRDLFISLQYYLKNLLYHRFRLF